MTDELWGYMQKSCCTKDECQKWSTDACMECRRKMIEANDAQIRAKLIDQIKPMLEELEGTFFWYETICEALDQMKGVKNE